MFAFSRSASTGAGGMNWGSGIEPGWSQPISHRAELQNSRALGRRHYFGRGDHCRGLRNLLCAIRRIVTLRRRTEPWPGVISSGTTAAASLRNGDRHQRHQFDEMSRAPRRARAAARAAEFTTTSSSGCGIGVVMFKGDGYYSNNRVYNTFAVCQPGGEESPALVVIGA